MTEPVRIRWRGTVKSRGDVAAKIPSTGDVVLVSRAGWKRWLVFRCPSGCGTELPINLDARAGPAWHLYSPGHYATLYPSVWRESGCGAHFILSRGRIWLLGQDDDRFGEDVPEDALVAKVLAGLTDASVHYFELAELVQAEPWDVLAACRVLRRRGQALEGSGDQRGRFSRLAP